MFRSVFRLTLIFTLALIVSGSILTYFSINYISNLKELTEKKIRDEEDDISDRIHQKIQTKTGEITSGYMHLPDSISARIGEREFPEIDPSVSLAFIMQQHGDLLLFR